MPSALSSSSMTRIFAFPGMSAKYSLPASPPLSTRNLWSGGRPRPPNFSERLAAEGGRRSTDGEAWRPSPRLLVVEPVPLLLLLPRGFLLDILLVSGPVARVADVLLVALGE